MAFDMHSGANSSYSQEKVAHHEEFIFQLMEGKEAYPTANYIWDNFYKSPKIDPEKSGKLVHELLNLKSFHKNSPQSKLIISLVDRLVLFFNQAYISQTEITCHSD